MNTKQAAELAFLEEFYKKPYQKRKIPACYAETFIEGWATFLAKGKANRGGPPSFLKLTFEGKSYRYELKALENADFERMLEKRLNADKNRK